MSQISFVLGDLSRLFCFC